MDELIDILDAQGQPTGETALKSRAHALGLFHPTVHIWLYNKTGEVLLQRRSETKDTYPGLWDVSVAGHVGAGEAIEMAAQREMEEEIGFLAPLSALQRIGVFKSVQKHHAQLVDCEYHHTFLCELTVAPERLSKQESEVDAVALVSLTALERALADKDAKAAYVPHAPHYYATVFQEIRARL
jgi:isopentenyl-diphosphate Delta-isomerase